MSFRMTAGDWVRLDQAEGRVAQARDWGLEPDPEDEELIALYSEL